MFTGELHLPVCRNVATIPPIWLPHHGWREAMKQVMPLLLWQLVVTLVVSGAFLAVDLEAAYSALLGGICCVVPNAYLASRLLLKSGTGDARAFVRAAYVGEAGKLGLTAVLFTLVFVWVKPLAPGALFTGFIAAIAVGWFGLIWVGKDPIK